MTFPGRLEAAYGADLTTDPNTWTWTDETTNTAEDNTTITRGRSGNAADAQPGNFSMLLNNGDGRLTPQSPASSLYPGYGRGRTAARVLYTHDDPFLYLPGNTTARASTPDAAALDITGDISGLVEFECPVRIPPAGSAYMVGGKYVTSGNQRSWFLDLLQDGTLRFTWSTDGTSANADTMTMSLPFPRPDAGAFTVAWWFDVSDAGNKVMRWYWIRGTISDLLSDTAAALQDTVTESGTTSIFASTAPLEYGTVTGIVAAGFLPYPGGIRHAQLLSGNLDAGSTVANPNFSGQAAGTTSFSDGARTWTINSPAEITDEHVRMIGLLSAIEPTWPGHGVEGTAQVRWQVAGILRRLRQGEKPLDSALRRFVSSPSKASEIVAYWPMEDGANATEFASPIPGVQPAPIWNLSEMRLAADATFDASSPLPTVQAGDRYIWAGNVPTTGRTSDRVDIFINMATGPGAATRVVEWSTDGTVARWELYIDSANVTIIGFSGAGAGLELQGVASDASFFDDWVLFSFSSNQSGGDVAWDLDIVPLAVGSVFGMNGTVSTATWGETTSVFADDVAPTDGISFGHVIVSTGTATGHLAPAQYAYDGEPATSRIFRHFTEQGITCFIDGRYGVTWDEVADLGVDRMGPQLPLPLMALVNEAVAVDHGYLGESREVLGTTYRAAGSLLNQTPRLSPGSLDEVVPQFTPTEDDQGYVNDVTAKRINGSSYRALGTGVDNPEDGSAERYETSPSFNAYSDAQLPDYAGWGVTEGTWPEMRIPAITIELGKNDDLVPEWLACTVGDVLDVTNLPDEYPTTETLQLMVGYRETIAAPGIWTVSANGLPAGPWTVGVLDAEFATPDDTLARMTSDASTLNTGIDDNDTSLSVATDTSDGTPLWTTDADYFPMDILINGERMTLSAISGGSSPQTFTVSARSVNGIVRSHASGSDVTVADPIRLTL